MRPAFGRDLQLDVVRHAIARRTPQRLHLPYSATVVCENELSHVESGKSFMRSFIITPDGESQRTTVGTYADWQLRYATVSIAFCYRDRLDVRRLRDALTHVLVDFPAYAGRLRVDASTLRIEHGGGGALLELAASSASFEALAALAERGDARVLCPSISPRRVINGSGPLLATRLTETTDGCVLGVTWHHSVGDLQSTMQLLRAWSKAYANAAHDAPPPVFDRAQYLEQRMPDPASAVSTLRLCSASEVFSLVPLLMQHKTRTDFEFSWDELAELQQWGMRDGRHEFVSPCDALCAHAFSVLRALSPERPLGRLVVGVNYRKRVGLPANLLGNMVSTLTVNVEPEGDAVAIASDLRAKLVAYASEHADYHATCRFLNQHQGRFERMRTVPNLIDTRGGTWIVTNWSNFGLYDLDFEGAAPALFCSLTEAPLPLMTNLFERPNRRGLTLSMHLPEVLARRADSAEGRVRMHTRPVYDRYTMIGQHDAYS
jgi:shikimate O-hydroxycinnamoyltransferase